MLRHSRDHHGNVECNNIMYKLSLIWYLEFEGDSIRFFFYYCFLLCYTEKFNVNRLDVKGKGDEVNPDSLPTTVLFGLHAQQMTEDKSRRSHSDVLGIEEKAKKANEASKTTKLKHSKQKKLNSLQSVMKEVMKQDKEKKDGNNNVTKKVRIKVDTTLANEFPEIKPEDYMPFYSKLQLDTTWWLNNYEPCRKNQALHQKRQLAQSASILSPHPQNPTPHHNESINLATAQIRSQFNVKADEVLKQLKCIQTAAEIRLKPIKVCIIHSISICTSCWIVRNCMLLVV